MMATMLGIEDRTDEPVELVGRAHEQRVLSSIYESIRSGGSGRLVLVGGEAGIGKTTLVEHFLEFDLPDGVPILNGACYDVVSPPPYALWLEVLSSLQQVSDGPDFDFFSRIPDQGALFEAVWDRLESVVAGGPAIVVLEDAHWADHESLELLRHIGRRVRDVSLLIIATYRNDEILTGQPLSDALLPLVRECGADRIDLRQLSRDLILELVDRSYQLEPDDASRLADELDQRTGGNPLFIVELLRSIEMAGFLTFENGRWQLAELSDVEIPLLVRQLIDRRLRYLDPDAREILQTAAIMGFEVRPDMLLAVSGRDRDNLSAYIQQAVNAFLLEQSPASARLRFRHALVQEALYSSAPILWRQSQHRRIAEILAEQPGSDPAVVAEHFLHSDDPRYVMWALKSARRAQQLSAPHSVIARLTPLLHDLELLTPHERIEACRLRGWAHEMTGAFHEANRDFLTELRAAIETGDRYSERDALVRLAELWTGRDYQRVGDYIEQALQVTAGINDQPLLARTHNRFGTWYMSQDDPERAREHHQQALAICKECEDRAGIAETSDFLGLAIALSGDLLAAEAHVQQATTLHQTLNDQRGLSNSRANYAHLGPTYLTDAISTTISLDDCIQAGEEALETAQKIDYMAGMVYARVRLGSAYGASGVYGDASAMIRQSISEAENVGNRQLLSAAHSIAGLLSLDLFDAESGHRHAQRAFELAGRVASTFRIRMSAAILAMSLTALGKFDEARSILEQTAPVNRRACSVAQFLHGRARVELELESGNPDRALHCLDTLIQSIPSADSSQPGIRLSLLRGQSLNALGKFDEAESWLAAAREAASQLGARGVLWRTHREIGLAHRGRDDRLNATRAFADARQVATEIGETLTEPDGRTRFLDAVHAQTSGPGELTPLQQERLASGGLTRRQCQIAAKITTGCTNREIAMDLSISERTVESHITEILKRLDLGSRAQVAAWAVESGLLNRLDS